MSYCLDTNIIIDFLRNDKKIVDLIKDISDDELFTTYINLCELYKGAYLSSRTESELKIIHNFINSLEILDFSEDSCDFFGKEYARLSNVGKITQESDLMIASIAKVNDLIVITRNKKHFENIDVKIECW